MAVVSSAWAVYCAAKQAVTTVPISSHENAVVFIMTCIRKNKNKLNAETDWIISRKEPWRFVTSGNPLAVNSRRQSRALAWSWLMGRTGWSEGRGGGDAADTWGYRGWGRRALKGRVMSHLLICVYESKYRIKVVERSLCLWITIKRCNAFLQNTIVILQYFSKKQQ